MSSKLLILFRYTSSKIRDSTSEWLIAILSNAAWTIVLSSILGNNQIIRGYKNIRNSNYEQLFCFLAMLWVFSAHAPQSYVSYTALRRRVPLPPAPKLAVGIENNNREETGQGQRRNPEMARKQNCPLDFLPFLGCADALDWFLLDYYFLYQPLAPV